MTMYESDTKDGLKCKVSPNTIDLPSDFSGDKRVHVSVYEVNEDDEDDGWVGTFWVDFEKTAGRGRGAYVADWDSVKGGDGAYVHETGPWWAVEEAAKLLHKNTPHNWLTFNTGKGDK